MRAEDLRLEELVAFSEGLVSLHGRRLVLHDLHAMAQLRKDLVETAGAREARRILARFGFFWGEADAAAMKRIADWDSREEWLRAGPRLRRLQGVGKPDLVSLQLEPTGAVRIEEVWEDSAESEEQLIELGPSPEAGCWILQGYASGYASRCLEKEIYFQEQSCRGRGDAECRAVGMDRESWGDEADAVARRFLVGDIRGKIDSMTAELRRQAIALARERKRVLELQSQAAPGLAELRSRSFREVLNLARRVARFDTPVLITGESGTGKEVVARFIHDSSERHGSPFVAINCGALPENLLESELFGHKAGSFTGANRDRAGLFEEAQGGTLLLDEIGDIIPALQVKLLRVLQEQQVRRVGENRMRPIDVRVIAATNRQLDEDVRAGRFREDLFYRLRVVEIEVPPLRKRPEDILPLARYFTRRLQEKLKFERLELDPATLTQLEAHAWPGNVRELENALERAAVMSEDGWIRPEHLPPELQSSRRAWVVGGSGGRSLADLERDYILAVLDETNGSRSRAAAILGISTTTLWRKLKAWGASED
jgi:DNA-binding NtrC family response regulator